MLLCRATSLTVRDLHKVIMAYHDNKFELDYYSNRLDTLSFEFSYPRLDGKIKYLEVGLSDVRASDGIRVSYDFDRDGFVIEQPYINEVDMGDYIDATKETWEEVGFFESWALERKGTKINEETK